MPENRYRLSDQGVLLYWNFDKRMWLPTDCPYSMRHCGETCRYFKLNGNMAKFKCHEPETIWELEE